MILHCFPSSTLHIELQAVDDGPDLFFQIVKKAASTFECGMAQSKAVIFLMERKAASSWAAVRTAAAHAALVSCQSSTKLNLRRNLAEVVTAPI